jgi:hypothetical protein
MTALAVHVRDCTDRFKSVQSAKRLHGHEWASA